MKAERSTLRSPASIAAKHECHERRRRRCRRLARVQGPNVNRDSSFRGRVVRGGAKDAGGGPLAELQLPWSSSCLGRRVGVELLGGVGSRVVAAAGMMVAALAALVLAAHAPAAPPATGSRYILHVVADDLGYHDVQVRQQQLLPIRGRRWPDQVGCRPDHALLSVAQQPVHHPGPRPAPRRGHRGPRVLHLQILRSVRQPPA